MQNCNAVIGQTANIDVYHLKDNGVFPNSPLPVLHYKKALHLSVLFQGITVKKMLYRNGWTNHWKGGINIFHHYYSTAHEVIVAIDGKTLLLLGGENGAIISIQKGDVIVIPAGVAHKNLGREDSITCIAGYSGGNDFDMKYGLKGERPKTDREIASVSLPEAGPVCGADDPMLTLWKLVRKVPATVMEASLL